MGGGGGLDGNEWGRGPVENGGSEGTEPQMTGLSCFGHLFFLVVLDASVLLVSNG